MAHQIIDVVTPYVAVPGAASPEVLAAVRETSADALAQVPGLAASAGASAATQAIAANPEVVSAAADLAQSDAGLVRLTPMVEPFSVAIVDEEGRRTWLEAGLDGRPTDRAAIMVGLVDQREDISDLAFAVVDDGGRRTELEVGLDGRLTRRVIDSIQSRLTFSIGIPVVSGPDICCIGDSLTAGAGASSTGGQPYPAILQTLTGHTVRNAGVGGETSPTITARLDAYPLMLLPQGGVIPGSGPVPVAVSPVRGQPVRPLIQGSGGGASGTLAGVPGSLALVQPNGGSNTWDDANYYTFTRTSAGSQVAVDRPTAFLHDFAQARRGDIWIIWIGQNGPSDQRAIEDTRCLIESMSAAQKRWLVLSRPTSTNETDDLYAAAFGFRHLSPRRYLIDYGLSDAGLTPTTQDATDIANGIVPTSLRSDGVHLNGYGYAALAKAVGARLSQMGWI